MIPGSAVYHLAEAMAPLYTAAFLGYASVRWLRAFSDEQCAGINHFVALYAIPAMIFRMVATSDPYGMNGRLIAADTLQKAAILLSFYAGALALSRYRRRRRRGGDDDDGHRGGRKAAAAADDRRTSSPMKWAVTNFSAATMSSIIIIGVPLLDGVYGATSGGLVAQLVVMQVSVWFNVLIFMYEFIGELGGGGGTKIIPETSAAVVENVVAEVEESTEIVEVVVAPSTARGSAVAATPAEEVLNGARAAMTAAAQPPAPSVTMHVVWTVGKKLLKIPNTYASFLGLAWSLVAFKFGIKMPKIVDDSLLTISTTAIGLSMFASGTFIARQERFVPCGYGMASLSMVLKFLVGPVVMLLTSVAMGLHGSLLRIAVVQAALPLAVSSFVYAEEYKVHADIMSTGVILGTFISLPVTIVYCMLLGL